MACVYAKDQGNWQLHSTNSGTKLAQPVMKNKLWEYECIFVSLLIT